MKEEDIPGVSVRVKAVVTDSIVIFVFMISVTYLFEGIENVPDYAKMIAFIFIFLLYDPIFTSVFGGTIGHMMLGIRVKRKNNQQKNLFFLLAIIRFMVKVLLGWISLLTIYGNKKGQAIHDLLVGSVVLYAKQTTYKE